MNEQEQLNYQRVAGAIEYIAAHFQEQPALEQVAEAVHLSPYHFQRLFTEWAGTSPKKFLQYVSICHAKKLLKEQQATLADAADNTGLSGTGRLHDLFISIEGMTPAEYKQGGAKLLIHYSFAGSPFGGLLVASTPKGICHLAFYEDAEEALAALRTAFPKAVLQEQATAAHQHATQLFRNDWTNAGELRLHLKGTPFQLKVWEALLKIPPAGLSTYGNIAAGIGHASASRAVGTAVGSNPVAFLIPCHRVIASSGGIGNYRWGATRKTAMMAWELSKQEPPVIENCTTADVAAIVRLYEDARSLQRVHNMVVWPHFTSAFILEEIAQGRQWKLVLDGTLACNWATAYEDRAIWGAREQGDALYIHRLVTDPAFRGRRLISQVVAWAKEHAAKLGLRYVRLDTLGNNTKLIRHYTGAGFAFLGMVTLTDTQSLPAHYQAEPDCCLFEIRL